MNADLLTILEYWEREKGISRDILLNAVEEALISAAKKSSRPCPGPEGTNRSQKWRHPSLRHLTYRRTR